MVVSQPLEVRGLTFGQVRPKALCFFFSNRKPNLAADQASNESRGLSCFPLARPPSRAAGSLRYLGHPDDLIANLHQPFGETALPARDRVVRKAFAIVGIDKDGGGRLDDR